MITAISRAKSDVRSVLHARWYRMLVTCAEHRSSLRHVCPRWNSFEAFCEDMGAPPEGRSILCLRDENKGYAPGNVFWGTRRDRQQTVAHARVIEWEGKRLSLTGWARELQLLPETLRKRLATMSPEKALSARKWPNRHAPRTKSLNKSSSFPGVSWRPTERKWEAKLRHSGRLIHLGLFPCERAAAQAVQRARLEIAVRPKSSRVTTGCLGSFGPDQSIGHVDRR